ncbi:hypothetical protein [Sphingomonas sp. CROZ-RG-20F-R02-07]|uniref:hypothetical protein n=1 Tax=Sphingomonas sp. CROZ-RG-20F-R02-07 TaxID=2914832 RepID=UPI001F5626EC|nr:hypothetical protein [Sphingomonas sp. CROZ-RG-20F-R02-07]
MTPSPPPVALMRMALALLDKDGGYSPITACHLQAAIDAATGALPLQPGEELPDEALSSFEITSTHK